MNEIDDTRMQDLAEKYPEYGDMDTTNLINSNNDLIREQNAIESEEDDPTRLDEITERKEYLERLIKLKQEDDLQQRLRSLREEDGQTVTIDRSKTDPKPVVIKRKEQRSKSDPEVRFDIPPDVEAINPNIAIQDFIRRNYNIENFRFNQYDETAIDLQLNIDTTSRNNITYRPKTSEGKPGAPQIVLKNDKNGILQFNEKPDSIEIKRAVDQFKKEIKKIIGRENTTRDMSMINTSTQIDDIDGLTPKEMRELRGVLKPTGTMIPEARRKALQIQANRFKELLDATNLKIENFRTNNSIGDDIDLDNYAEYGELKRRAEGLEKARDLTLKQIQLEGVREQQEEDITRLQKFKKWAKENMVGLTALSVSIAGLITTLIVGARKALVAGAQATSRFGKAIADIGKKLWPLLAPILSIIGTAISLGATGLAWLASNLWVLLIAFTYFIYDQYKQKKNKK